VIGIDYEPAVARAAAGRYRRAGLAFACMDGGRLAIRRQSADLICAFQVIEHLRDQVRFVRDVAATLRPSGVAILSTPNALVHRGPRNPFHLHEFTPDELHALLAQHFTHVRLAGQSRPRLGCARDQTTGSQAACLDDCLSRRPMERVDASAADAVEPVCDLSRHRACLQSLCRVQSCAI
jgi:SAM-dependent methyltransferase